MVEPEFIELFVKPLEKGKISYLISGSVASILYGEPRATMDIDLGIYMEAAGYEDFHQFFPAEEFYVPPSDVLIIEAQREVRGHFNIIHHNTGYKADFYPSRNHPYLDWALANKREFFIGDTVVKLAPPEYIIMWKLAFYQEGRSEKHLRDIKGILVHQGEALNYGILEKAIEELKLTEAWAMVR